MKLVISMNLVNALIAYFLGSITPGYWFAKIKGINIRKIGSGNIGATNVYRAMGLKWAFLVGFYDILKGFIPAYFFGFEYGIIAILGHAFSVWLKFRGGKGIATTIGLLIGYGINSGNWLPFFVFLASFLNIVLLSGIVSLGSLTAIVSACVSIFFTDFGKFPYFLFLTLMIYYLHRSNIKRLIRGEEKRVSRVKI